AHMMAAMPRYRRYAGGIDGGPDNPLGARALYLYRDGHDTFFRLHGTTEPESIGQAVSSGCIRLFNQDIIDLYNRVPVGTHVTVLQG
ncbi:MAG: L,D-transpeptidase, partial [Pseudolabrys sp.]